MLGVSILGWLAVIIVITTLLNGLFLFGHYWLLNRAVIRQHDQVLDEIAGFFSSENGNPSEFAKLAGGFIEQLSRDLILRAKTTFMGVESGSSRNAQKLVDAAITDSNPLLSSLSSIYPSLGKILRKNPQALAGLSQLKFPGVGNNGGSSDTHYNPNKFVQ